MADATTPTTPPVKDPAKDTTQTNTSNLPTDQAAAAPKADPKAEEIAANLKAAADAELAEPELEEQTEVKEDLAARAPDQNGAPRDTYTLTAGKHKYQAVDGSWVLAKVGDPVPLTRKEYDSLQPRFTFKHKGE